MASKSLKFRSDNRAGVNGTLHRVCCSRNLEGQIIGLRFRVGRAVEGSARLVYKEMQGANMCKPCAFSYGCY